ncbi:MAG: LysR family transcriptional regulator [Nocardioidaceae bacterium]|nr:LysR family transcriptional regulator [Nocardioidaceae bacterium]NUS52593.1 LysR family transcriptional regulator [Nocardioidaceae bacterium]
MDPRRLEMLLELSRLGSMREVAETLHVTTSTVSQQVAALSREVRQPLVEPVGRRVRLTPAGRRLADHAVTILAAVEAARVDLDPSAEPAGLVRVASFSTAIRGALLPAVRVLAERHPDVRVQILEHEPPEAFAMLAADEVDLALTYDYNLAPATIDRTLQASSLGETEWALGVPSAAGRGRGDALETFRRFRDQDWIVASRNTADGDAVRTVASMAGFQARVVHQADSLELVQDLIAAGLGVGLLPARQPVKRGVGLRRLRDPAVVLRGYAVTRRGRADWPPLALLLRLLGDLRLTP